MHSTQEKKGENKIKSKGSRRGKCIKLQTKVEGGKGEKGRINKSD
jgi:hypothetical protein